MAGVYYLLIDGVDKYLGSRAFQRLRVAGSVFILSDFLTGSRKCVMVSKNFVPNLHCPPCLQGYI
jgi:hypothetical protein